MRNILETGGKTTMAIEWRRTCLNLANHLVYLEVEFASNKMRYLVEISKQ